jgi:hypothetical protein
MVQPSFLLTAGRLDGARERRIATKRHVRSVLAVIGDILYAGGLVALPRVGGLHHR